MDERGGREAVFVAVFKVVRLGLVVEALDESLVAGGLGERPALEALAWSGLAGDVGVRGWAGDFRLFEGVGLVAGLLVDVALST
jgi:hypothetical protein